MGRARHLMLIVQLVAATHHFSLKTYMGPHSRQDPNSQLCSSLRETPRVSSLSRDVDRGTENAMHDAAAWSS
jgi:hypothetical protein